MSGDATLEEVLRFVSLRGPEDLSTKQKKNHLVKLSGEDESESEFIKSLTKEDERKAQVWLVTQYQKSPEFINGVSAIERSYWELNALVVAGEITSNEDFKNALSNIFGETLEYFIDNDLEKIIRRLSDSILADFVVCRLSPQVRDALYGLLKACWLTKRIVARELILGDGVDLNSVVDRMQIVLPRKLFRNLHRVDIRPRSSANVHKKGNDERNELKVYMKQLRHAHRELSTLNEEDAAIYLPDEIEIVPIPPEGFFQRVSQMFGIRAHKEIEIVTSTRMVWNPEVFRIFSSETRDLLSGLGLLGEGSNHVLALRKIESEFDRIGPRLAERAKRSQVLLRGGEIADLGNLRADYNEAELAEILANCEHASGIGDLLVVKQKLKNYELGEFSHIENVLAGERRERTHRRLRETEEIEKEIGEYIEESEKDLQSAEHHDMQRETALTIKTDFQFEAGMQASASYGPTVSASANTNTSISASIEFSKSNATRYAKDVTERTVNRVKERTYEERVQRLLEQVEETNLHSVDNSYKGSAHIRGIYRWLNKIFEAQTYSYGKRLMFEFTIPEPAFYYHYATFNCQSEENLNPPPEPYRLDDEGEIVMGEDNNPVALSPEHIARDNYFHWISLYKAQNVPAPPPSRIHFSKAVVKTQKAVDENKEVTPYAEQIEIELKHEQYSYCAEGANTTWSVWGIGTTWREAQIAIGPKIKSREGRGSLSVHFSEPYEGKISGFVSTRRDIRNIAVIFNIHGQLTETSNKQWQQDVYEAIISAYQQRRAEYEERKSETEIQSGFDNMGRNPQENLRLIRDELKKLAINTITEEDYYDFGSIVSSEDEVPQLNFDAVREQGAHIRFFENAFEWNNMTYVFYPYFWGRKGQRWISALHLTDPDPEFAAFLKAGAVRIQVPVRPGFERAIAHYCQFHQLWEGNDIPLMEDETYLPISLEIQESLGKPLPAAPIGAPWDVTLPTSLVLLQNLGEIPSLVDSITGRPISLINTVVSEEHHSDDVDG